MFNRPVYALPLDVFRVLIGLLSLAYFLHALAEARDVSAAEGLIDHDLSASLFWYTRLGLFQPGMASAVVAAFFVVAALASVLLVLGHRVKVAAAVLYLIAVSTYRWNFLVMYVDDAILHLMLLWLLLLPVGRTLRLGEWLREGRAALERWKGEVVPGTAVRCFLANLALLYLAAGLWKWTSPLWRDGAALFALLKLPISFAPDFWRPEHLPLLRVLNYAALFLEPLFPLAFVLPTHHRLKWALLFGIVAFHVGIIATLRIPYANLACLAAGVVVFRDELMGVVGTPASCPQVPPPAGRAGSAAWGLLLLLIAATLGEVIAEPWRSPPRAAGTADGGEASADPERTYNPLEAPLWALGVAQSHRLFDWIDDRNFTVTYEVFETGDSAAPRGIDPCKLFPGSTRSALLQCYLHGVTWQRGPRARADELRTSLCTRFARRYCRNHAPAGRVWVYATVRRITAGGGDGGEGRRELLMEFSARDGEPVLHYVRPRCGVCVASSP